MRNEREQAQSKAFLVGLKPRPYRPREGTETIEHIITNVGRTPEARKSSHSKQQQKPSTDSAQQQPATPTEHTVGNNHLSRLNTQTSNASTHSEQQATETKPKQNSQQEQPASSNSSQ